jgi:hypothetical protein
LSITGFSLEASVGPASVLVGKALSEDDAAIADRDEDLRTAVVHTREDVGLANLNARAVQILRAAWLLGLRCPQPPWWSWFGATSDKGGWSQVRRPLLRLSGHPIVSKLASWYE